MRSMRLAGELGVEPEHLLLDDGELLGLDGDVGRATGHPAQRLVHQDAGVRQRVALALGARGQQELAHRGGHAHRVGGDVARRQHHRVVDRHAGADRSAGRVDVEVDVLGRVLGGEQQNLRAQPVGDVVVDLRAQEDDALGEQALIDRVGEVQTHRRSNACQSRLTVGYLLSRVPLFTDTNQPGPSRTPRSARVRSQRHFVSPDRRPRRTRRAASASAVLGVFSASSVTSASSRDRSAVPKNSVVSIDVAVGVGDRGRLDRPRRWSGRGARRRTSPAAGCSAAGSRAAAAARCRTAATSAPAARSGRPGRPGCRGRRPGVQQQLRLDGLLGVRCGSSASNSSRVLPCFSSASANLASSWSRPCSALCRVSSTWACTIASRAAASRPARAGPPARRRGSARPAGCA